MVAQAALVAAMIFRPAGPAQPLQLARPLQFGAAPQLAPSLTVIATSQRCGTVTMHGGKQGDALGKRPRGSPLSKRVRGTLVKRLPKTPPPPVDGALSEEAVRCMPRSTRHKLIQRILTYSLPSAPQPSARARMARLAHDSAHGPSGASDDRDNGAKRNHSHTLLVCVHV